MRRIKKCSFKNYYSNHSLGQNSYHGTRYLSIKVPGPSTSSWERGAKLVKNTDVTNKYLEHIRDTHDPSLHLKTIEDELRGTMGKALGKQGEKIVMALRRMEEERRIYVSKTSTEMEIRNAAIRHNEFREKAKKARWELLVHRQAVGFIVGNHKYVTDTFPISEALPVPDIGESQSWIESSSKPKPGTEPVQRTFGDQLNWWQQIGRWK